MSADMERSDRALRVIFVTSQWPTLAQPSHSPFVRTEVESLRKIGVDVDLFHFSGRWNPVYYGRAIWDFRRQLSAKRYDLVHVRFGQCGMVALSQHRLPVVVRFGGSDLIGWKDNRNREPWQSKLLRTVSGFVARRADQVIIPDRNMAAYLPPREYTVLPAGVDLGLFRPMDQAQAWQQLGLPSGMKLVLFAADSTKIIKRHDLADGAVQLLKKEFSIELVVTGNVPHASMPVYMNACDVLVLTSQHEGSPNVVKEALACNLPVISVDVGDVRERIGSAERCMVCDGDSVEEIAAALKTVLQQDGRPASLRGAVLDLDALAIAHGTVVVYESALGGRR